MTSHFPWAIRDAVVGGRHDGPRVQRSQNIPDFQRCIVMKKAERIRILEKVLGTDVTLDFLKKLEEKEIETLVACVRNKVDQG